MAYSKLHVAAGGRARGRKQELKELWNAEMFGHGGTSADAKNNFLFLPKLRMEPVFRPHPENTSKSHVVSHHFTVSMDTHIKLHHLLCIPPFILPSPLHPPKSNPVQRWYSALCPPHLLSFLPPAGRLGLATPAILPPSPHTPSMLPSFATTCSPSTLLSPPPHTHPLCCPPPTVCPLTV